MGGLTVALNNGQGAGDKYAVSPSENRRIAADRVLGLILTIMTLCLHAVFFYKAGAFWRDEANSVCLAAKPGFADVWSAMKLDSFPGLHLVLIRSWANLWGSSDASLRMLGFTIGISIVAALWFKSREFGSKAPLISLLLMGMNPVMTRSLDSTRPNGLAVLTTILAFTLVWRAVQKPGIGRLSVATLALILSAQTLYQSTIFILSIGLAAISVGFLMGGFRRVLPLTVPFIVSALSLVPYAGHLQEVGKWSPVAMAAVGTKEILLGFLDVLRSPLSWFAWVWGALVILAIVGAIKCFVRHGRKECSRRSEQFALSLYCSVTLLALTVGATVFFKVADFVPQLWHYVPFLAVAVISAEPLVEQAVFTNRTRVIALLAIVGIAFAALYPAGQILAMRMTSIDYAAAALERETRPNDLVVLVPWYYGVSFNRYYRGSAPWVTFPGLQETGLHRFDLLKERMKQPESIMGDVARILTTLQHGGRIWVVGVIYSEIPKFTVAPLPHAPLPTTGWSSSPYVLNWNLHLMATLAEHAQKAQVVPTPSAQMINPLESPNVVVFQGWQ